MRLQSLNIRQYRNITEARLEADEGVNIFFGQNAQGKTNALEALWLFTGGKSFRGAKDRELPQFESDKAVLEASFYAEDREQTAKIVIDKNRHYFVNDIEQTKISNLVGRFPAVIFSPDHLQLVKEGPEGRRAFLDAAICQIRPAYIKDLTSYYRVLSQRNAVLKEWKYSPNESLLDILTQQVAKFGQQIVKERLNYTNCLINKVSSRYAGLSSDRETLSIAYEPGKEYDTESERHRTDQLLTMLQEKKKADIEAGFTSVGPHREDLQIKIDQLSARSFGSQGQQRSAVLALKLAEAEILKEQTGECPMVLLDDVMSELDTSRQEYIVNQLDGWQVFITCCEPESILPKSTGKLFRVENGCIEEV